MAALYAFRYMIKSIYYKIAISIWLFFFSLPVIGLIVIFVGYSSEPKVFEFCESIEIGSEINVVLKEAESISFTSIGRYSDDTATVYAAWGLGACCIIGVNTENEKVLKKGYSCI